ncbi:MAG: mannosyl-3-phosphoglycerate synthase [Archaeoglobales archaeon]|nr:MAG: mannosyl-3-phosphoglycerate synthase [Archaeoglobales archaeon]
MLIELPKHSEVFGSVKIYEVQKVLKLESGKVVSPLIRGFSRDELEDVFSRMAVIIPVKDERIHLFDGVIRSIPDGCRIIVVSNSRRIEQDMFKIECDIISNFHKVTGQNVTIVHQKDPGLSLAFKETEYNAILDRTGVVRDGKGEGMIVGTLLAKMFGCEYVGFVDADNYIPCSVNEYVRIYAGVLSLAETPYAMVRLHWRYKPKVIEDRLYFRKWGRVSEITNKYLNMLLSMKTGFETIIVKTGNAGEHAMTMNLAEIISFSTGFSVEPYQIVYLLEEFWNGETRFKDALSSGVSIYQVETINPHVHEEKGDEHVRDMLLSSLSVIYHSRFANDNLKLKIFEELKEQEIVKSRREIRRCMAMPPICDIDFKKFRDVFERYSETLKTFG